MGAQKGKGWGEGAATSAEDGAFIGDLVSSLQTRAIPALVPELVLALVDGDLDALDGRGSHIGVTHTHFHLPPAQARQCQAHCVGIEHRLRGEAEAQNVVGCGPAGSEEWVWVSV